MMKYFLSIGTLKGCNLYDFKFTYMTKKKKQKNNSYKIASLVISEIPT